MIFLLHFFFKELPTPSQKKLQFSIIIYIFLQIEKAWGIKSNYFINILYLMGTYYTPYLGGTVYTIRINNIIVILMYFFP